MVKIVLNDAGIIELLQSEPMQAIVREHATTIANNVGEGFVVGEAIGHDRCRAFVAADTEEARKACYKDNILLKALGS